MRLSVFQEDEIDPREEAHLRELQVRADPWVVPALIEELKAKATAVLDGDEVVVNGRKWWSTGVGHPNCKALIFMGLTDPDADRYHQHSMVLVPLDTPGVKVCVLGWGCRPVGRRGSPHLLV